MSSDDLKCDQYSCIYCDDGICTTDDYGISDIYKCRMELDAKKFYNEESNYD